MCSLLVREPFSCSPALIASLTDAQLLRVYFRPRDEEGELLSEEPPAEGEGGSLERACRQLWRERGESEAEIEAHWQRYCQANGIAVRNGHA